MLVLFSFSDGMIKSGFKIFSDDCVGKGFAMRPQPSVHKTQMAANVGGDANNVSVRGGGFVRGVHELFVHERVVECVEQQQRHVDFVKHIDARRRTIVVHGVVPLIVVRGDGECLVKLFATGDGEQRRNVCDGAQHVLVLSNQFFHLRQDDIAVAWRQELRASLRIVRLRNTHSGNDVAGALGSRQRQITHENVCTHTAADEKQHCARVERLDTLYCLSHVVAAAKRKQAFSFQLLTTPTMIKHNTMISSTFQNRYIIAYIMLF
mmetsp:Transcript_19352/g.33269  ORF Transcript_19352/g.33269 Transcript_19352/m.33269 type:complete len:264 (+) Transcript_19352:233-1024(+)